MRGYLSLVFTVAFAFIKYVRISNTVNFWVSPRCLLSDSLHRGVISDIYLTFATLRKLCPQLKATVGIEPTDNSFADCCLTTWLRRHIIFLKAARHQLQPCYIEKLVLPYHLAIAPLILFRKIKGGHHYHKNSWESDSCLTDWIRCRIFSLKLFYRSLHSLNNFILMRDMPCSDDTASQFSLNRINKFYSQLF